MSDEAAPAQPIFAIICHDKPGMGGVRAEVRPRHLDYLRPLGQRIVVAGPIDDPAGRPIGSLIIARFGDLAAARSFADADPYCLAGLFRSVEVAPWRQVFP